ncbi:MAG: LysR family transcriptional regulator, partial [Pseudomonas sp.]
MELGADQSTVSRGIGLLDAELGMRLFHRSGRGVSLTERGQHSYWANAKPLRREQGMRDNAEQGPAPLCRRVLANCGYTVLPSAAIIEEVAAGRLKSFRLENPDIRRNVAIVWPKNRV